MNQSHDPRRHDADTSFEAELEAIAQRATPPADEGLARRIAATVAARQRAERAARRRWQWTAAAAAAAVLLVIAVDRERPAPPDRLVPAPPMVALAPVPSLPMAAPRVPTTVIEAVAAPVEFEWIVTRLRGALESPLGAVAPPRLPMVAPRLELRLPAGWAPWSAGPAEGKKGGDGAAVGA
jgi:hypothetical protein